MKESFVMNIPDKGSHIYQTYSEDSLIRLHCGNCTCGDPAPVGDVPDQVTAETLDLTAAVGRGAEGRS